MELLITFPGGKKVNAELRGRTIATDQPREAGGEGSAPEPYALFAASIGTCAGFYALTFCQSRGLSTEGLAIRQRMRIENKKLIAVELDIDLPRDFPEKYREPLIRAADGCAVKRAILAMPEIVVRTVPAKPPEARA
ncbi:MAG TPA: OsmC family protein [Myxococcales bacterium]|nr:OsmC family protein [Myxococcales bacterium]